jgi:hypothetical protein
MPSSALRDEQLAATYLRGWASAVSTLFRDGISDDASTYSLGRIDQASRLLLKPKKLLRSEAEVSAILLGPRAFGRYLPPPRTRTADGRLALDVVNDVLRELLPIGPALATIQEGPPFSAGESQARESVDGVAVVLRLVVRDDGGIRDIKEQEVHLVPAAAFADPEHIEPYLRAWAAVLGEVLDNTAIEIETLMPHDFVHSAVFELKKAKTQDQLATAFRSKSRLGKWLAKT